MILDIRMNELDQIRDEEDAMYHAFVWTHIRPKQKIELEVDEDHFVKSFIRSRVMRKSVKKTFEAPAVRTLTFGQVIELKSLFKDMTLGDQIEAVSRVYKIDKRHLMTMRVTTFFSMFNFVVKEIKSIVKAESNFLRSDPEAEMIEAGIDNMNQFGIFSTIDSLAQGDILRWNAIEDTRYSRVFTKLFMDKTRSEVEKRLIKIRERKARQKQKK